MEKFDNVEYFTNRELSWLKFNIRVLNEAKDDDVKLFERLKFLSITSSNLDEFFMVRIASLKDMVEADYKKKDISGMSADKQLNVLAKETHNFVKKQYEIYNRSLLPLLKKEKLHIVSHEDELTVSESAFINEYFDEVVYPVLTPMAVDASRPFPLVRNKTLNIAALIRKRKDETAKKKKKDVYLGNVDGDMDFAMVQVPSVLPRVVEIPTESEERKLIYLEDIIEKNIPTAKHAYISNKKAVDSKGKIGIEAASKEDIIKALENYYTPMIEVKNDITNDLLLELGLVGGNTSKILREELCERLNIGYTNAKQLLNKLNMYNISRERLLDEMNKINKGHKR